MSYQRRKESRSVSRSRSPYYSRPRTDSATLRRDPPSRCSLLLRNLPKGARERDLRYYSEKYGPVRDIYLPRDYYTGEPRGIGFVEYTNPRDAEDAKHGLDGILLLDREITCVFAMQGRKRPDEYRHRSSAYRYNSNRYRRRSTTRSPRKRSRTRSPSRRHSRSARRRHRTSCTSGTSREEEGSSSQDNSSYSSEHKKSFSKGSGEDPDNASLNKQPSNHKEGCE